MKNATLFSLISLQSTVTLIQHLSRRDTLLEAGVISAMCLIAYAVGEAVIRKDFQKSDVKNGVLIGVLMGVLSQICVYYWGAHAGLFNVGAILFCLFPKQISETLLRFINRKSDKL